MDIWSVFGEGAVVGGRAQIVYSSSGLVPCLGCSATSRRPRGCVLRRDILELVCCMHHFMDTSHHFMDKVNEDSQAALLYRALSARPSQASRRGPSCSPGVVLYFGPGPGSSCLLFP
jgi:hypothetical protein